MLVSGTMASQLDEDGQKEDTWYNRQTAGLALSCYGTVVLRPYFSRGHDYEGYSRSCLNTAPTTYRTPSFIGLFTLTLS